MLVELGPIDLPRSFALHKFGAHDPTAELSPGLLRKAWQGERGPCLAELRLDPGGVRVRVEGHPQDAGEATGLLAAALADDRGAAGFKPAHPLLADLHRRNPGLRLVRVPWLHDLAFSAVLQQRVRTVEAMRTWRALALRFGGPPIEGLAVFPGADALARLPAWQLQALKVDPRRAHTLQRLARELRLHPLRARMGLGELRLRLSRVPGVGVWTTETTMGFGAGDPDALPLGDLHLPSLVARALAGEERGDDARMIELLEPYVGQRFRVLRLLYAHEVLAGR